MKNLKELFQDLKNIIEDDESINEFSNINNNSLDKTEDIDSKNKVYKYYVKNIFCINT